MGSLWDIQQYIDAHGFEEFYEVKKFLGVFIQKQNAQKP